MAVFTYVLKCSTGFYLVQSVFLFKKDELAQLPLLIFSIITSLQVVVLHQLIVVTTEWCGNVVLKVYIKQSGLFIGLCVF